MSSLALFTLTIGEPETLLAIDRMINYTPEPYSLTVWYDTCGQGINRAFYRELTIRTDDVVVLSKNHGPTAAVSYFLLYTHADYIILFGSDSLVRNDYFSRITAPFNTFGDMAVAGEPFHGNDFGDKDFLICGNDGIVNYPDPLLMIKRKVVNEVGGISPSFNFYGHEMTEFIGRCIAHNWKVAIVDKLLDRQYLTQTGITRNYGLTDVIKKNEKVFLHAKDRGFRGYNWWTNNLLKEELCPV